MKSFFLFSILIIVSSSIRAQYKVSAEIRPRTEYREGYKRLNHDTLKGNLLTSQRTRIGMHFIRDKIDFNISIQDVHTWGLGNEVISNNAALRHSGISMHEGWARVKFDSLHFIKVGRQPWVYEDQRLLSARNWNQHAVTYDGLLYRFRNKEWQLDAGLSYNNENADIFRKPYPSEQYRTLNFLLLRKRISEDAYLSAMQFLSGKDGINKPHRTYIKYTSGVFLKYTINNYHSKYNVYYQYGRNELNWKVNAWMLNIKNTIDLNQSDLSFNITYISGDDSTSSRKKMENLFDLHYGKRHGFYGYMDHFSNMEAGTNKAGLINLHLSFNNQSIKNVGLEAHYHYFSLAKPLFNKANQELSQSLGSEFDFIFRWEPLKNVILTAGYSFILPTGTMEYIQNLEDSEFSHWAFIMLNLKPVIFESQE